MAEIIDSRDRSTLLGTDPLNTIAGIGQISVGKIPIALYNIASDITDMNSNIGSINNPKLWVVVDKKEVYEKTSPEIKVLKGLVKDLIPANTLIVDNVRPKLAILDKTFTIHVLKEKVS